MGAGAAPLPETAEPVIVARLVGVG
jgi:hypothetical protein